MGLDMYLHATCYISNYEHDKRVEHKVIYKGVVDALKLDLAGITNNDSMTVTLMVAYWRKANHIHAWFVKHCQAGVDECQETHVSREQFIELRGLCEKALADKDLAPSTLPTKAGFFFGSTGYDEGYFQDCQDTVNQLNAILNNPTFNDYDFIYRSSW